MHSCIEICRQGNKQTYRYIRRGFLNILIASYVVSRYIGTKEIDRKQTKEQSKSITCLNPIYWSEYIKKYVTQLDTLFYWQQNDWPPCNCNTFSRVANIFAGSFLPHKKFKEDTKSWPPVNQGHHSCRELFRFIF